MNVRKFFLLIIFLSILTVTTGLIPKALADFTEDLIVELDKTEAYPSQDILITVYYRVTFPEGETFTIGSQVINMEITTSRMVDTIETTDYLLNPLIGEQAVSGQKYEACNKQIHIPDDHGNYGVEEKTYAVTIDNMRDYSNVVQLKILAVKEKLSIETNKAKASPGDNISITVKYTLNVPSDVILTRPLNTLKIDLDGINEEYTAPLTFPTQVTGGQEITISNHQIQIPKDVENKTYSLKATADPINLESNIVNIQIGKSSSTLNADTATAIGVAGASTAIAVAGGQKIISNKAKSKEKKRKSEKKKPQDETDDKKQMIPPEPPIDLSFDPQIEEALKKGLPPGVDTKSVGVTKGSVDTRDLEDLMAGMKDPFFELLDILDPMKAGEGLGAISVILEQLIKDSQKGIKITEERIINDFAAIMLTSAVEAYRFISLVKLVKLLVKGGVTAIVALKNYIDDMMYGVKSLTDGSLIPGKVVRQLSKMNCPKHVIKRMSALDVQQIVNASDEQLKVIGMSIKHGLNVNRFSRPAILAPELKALQQKIPAKEFTRLMEKKLSRWSPSKISRYLSDNGVKLSEAKLKILKMGDHVIADMCSSTRLSVNLPKSTLKSTFLLNEINTQTNLGLSPEAINNISKNSKLVFNSANMSKADRVLFLEVLNRQRNLNWSPEVIKDLAKTPLLDGKFSKAMADAAGSGLSFKNMTPLQKATIRLHSMLKPHHSSYTHFDSPYDAFVAFADVADTNGQLGYVAKAQSEGRTILSRAEQLKIWSSRETPEAMKTFDVLFNIQDGNYSTAFDSAEEFVRSFPSSALTGAPK